MVTTEALVVSATSYPVFLALSAAVLIAMLVHRRYFEAEIAGLALVASLLSTLILKEIFRVARPPDAAITLTSFSFPSGHAVGAGILAYVAYVGLARGRSVRTRLALGLVFALAAFLVGFSRLYLGVHRPGEVVAGFLVAGFFMFVAECIFRIVGAGGRDH